MIVTVGFLLFYYLVFFITTERRKSIFTPPILAHSEDQAAAAHSVPSQVAVSLTAQGASKTGQEVQALCTDEDQKVHRGRDKGSLFEMLTMS